MTRSSLVPLAVVMTLSLADAAMPSRAQVQAAPTAPVRPASDLPVRGRETDLRVGGQGVSGELLAVSVDSLWLLTREGSVQAVPVRPYFSVRVRRHGFGASQTALWIAIGAAVTGLALSTACGQVEDAECGGIFPGVGLSWALVGLPFGYALARSAHHRLPSTDGELRAYARFPQGLPEGFLDPEGFLAPASGEEQPRSGAGR